MSMRVVFSVQNILFLAQNYHLDSPLTETVPVHDQHPNKSPKYYAVVWH